MKVVGINGKSSPSGRPEFYYDQVSDLCDLRCSCRYCRNRCLQPYLFCRCQQYRSEHGDGCDSGSCLGGNFLGGGKFSLVGSVIGAYTIQALTTTLYAMNVKADQLPVYKAIVVIIIVALQSEVFEEIHRRTEKQKSIRCSSRRRAEIMKQKKKMTSTGFLLLITIVLFFVMYAAAW